MHKLYILVLYLQDDKKTLHECAVFSFANFNNKKAQHICVLGLSNLLKRLGSLEVNPLTPSTCDEVC